MCYFRLHKDGHGRVDLFSLPSLLTSQMDHSHERRSRDAQCSSSPWCCLYFSAIKTPTENTPKMITKYWSAKRTGSSLHQTTQQFVSLQMFHFRTEKNLCKAKAARPGTAPARQRVSKMRRWMIFPFSIIYWAFISKNPKLSIARDGAHTPLL